VSGGSVAGASSDELEGAVAGGVETEGVWWLDELDADFARPGCAQATSAVNATDNATDPAIAARVRTDTLPTEASRSQPACMTTILGCARESGHRTK
jgi:hypothetical protein